MAEAPKVSEASTLKAECNKRFQAMQNALNRWKPAYKDLSTYIDPTRGIFDGNRTGIGKMIDHKTLLDSHATYAKNITSSGMHTGMTDPSKPWFKLTLDNVLLDNIEGLGAWVDEITHRMSELINKSNIPQVFQNCYDELVQFGTGCFIILEDYEDVIRGRSFTAGEYMIATDNKGRVNAFAREFEMSIGQMVKEFGYESLSVSSQAAYKNNNVDQMVKVRNLIEENTTRIPGFEDFQNMKYRSIYWEAGKDGNTDLFLAKRGFKKFNVVAPRWNAITTDMDYGYGPGWHAIGDIKELQVTHKDKLIAQQKLGDPPTVEDGNVVGHSNKLPGGVTKSSSVAPNTGLRAAYQVDPHINEFRESIQDLHEKIEKHMFSKFFLMISNLEGQPNVTAFQVAQMKQEQMMVLGPILFKLNEEMHSKVIDIIFDIMNDAGLIPEPPQGIPGRLDIKVQFISILAQAQRAVGVQQIEATVASIGQMGEFLPGITDNLNGDEIAKEIAKGNMVLSKILNEPDAVAQIRKQRQDQQNKQIALEAGAQVADSASKLGKTPAGQGSVLDQVAGATGKVLAGK